MLIAVFLDGTHALSPSAAPEAGGRPASFASGPQIGSASVPPALVEPSLDGESAFDAPAADLSAAGGDAPSPVGAPGDAGSGAPPAPAAITCDNDASLPMPVIGPFMEQLRSVQQQIEASTGPLPENIAGYVAGAVGCSPGLDPLTLVVNQLGPVLGAAGPVIDVLATVNPLLPPIPVPPPVSLPGLPAELNPVLAAAHPVTGEVCGQLAISVVVVAALASFPLPITGQHLYAVLGPLFDTCAILNPPQS